MTCFEWPCMTGEGEAGVSQLGPIVATLHSGLRWCLSSAPALGWEVDPMAHSPRLKGNVTQGTPFSCSCGIPGLNMCPSVNCLPSLPTHLKQWPSHQSLLTGNLCGRTQKGSVFLSSVSLLAWPGWTSSEPWLNYTELYHPLRIVTLSMVFIHLSPVQSGQLSMAGVVGTSVLQHTFLQWGFSDPASCLLHILCLWLPWLLCPWALIRLHSQFKHCLRLISGWNFTHLSSVFLLAGKEIIIPNAKLYENETWLSVRCSTIVHFPPLFCLDLIVSELIWLLLLSPLSCILCELPGISAEHSSEDEIVLL